MRTSQKAINLIKKWESFKAEPYLDTKVGRVWTIGYGTTVYPDGKAVQENDPEITPMIAEKYLKDHINKHIESQLATLCGTLVNQSQWDALVCFCYNVGMGPKLWKPGLPKGFRQSTLLQKILAKDYKAAALEFGKWKYDNGRVLAGLIARRKDEKALFEEDPYA